VHALGAHGPAAILWEPREAEIAEHAPAIELMHALTGERSATAVRAGGVRLGEGADAAAHKHGGKIRHRKVFGSGPRNPAMPKKARY
jgi:hypothetical protein